MPKQNIFLNAPHCSKCGSGTHYKTANIKEGHTYFQCVSRTCNSLTIVCWNEDHINV